MKKIALVLLAFSFLTSCAHWGHKCSSCSVEQKAACTSCKDAASKEACACQKK